MLCKIFPSDMAMFRFLLEARDNLAQFTVVDRHLGLVRMIFSPQSLDLVENALMEISETIPLFWEKIDLSEGQT